MRPFTYPKPLDERILVAVTREQLDAFAQAAARAGVTRAHYIREAVEHRIKIDAKSVRQGARGQKMAKAGNPPDLTATSNRPMNQSPQIAKADNG